MEEKIQHQYIFAGFIKSKLERSVCSSTIFQAFYARVIEACGHVLSKRTENETKLNF